MVRYCLILIVLTLNVNAQDIIKENLGPKINTQFSETKPIISPDGKILYFARQNYPDNIKGEKDEQDIYYAILTETEWSNAVNIGEPLNDKHPNGVSSVSPDGNSLLVINAYHPTGLTMGGVSISKKENNYWAKPEKINIENFYNLNSHVDYYMSNNERELFLTIEREDSYGDQDIYISLRIDEFNWSEPINLGPDINSDKAEFSPFLAADNRTLFFASYGHKGYGDSDIYYSKRLDDSWTNWSKPVNLGEDVNSEEFEGYYSIPASGDYAYYVSTKNSINGSKDIYKATLPYKFRPDPVLLIAGNVYDEKTKAPVAASISIVNTINNEDEGFALSNYNDGAYKIILTRGYSYEFLAERHGYIGIVEYRDLTHITEYEEVENDLRLVPIENGQKVTSHHIFFEGNTDKFTEEAQTELKRFVNILKNNPGIKMEVGVHAHISTSATENLKISESRASAVKSFLESLGIHPQRLLPLGYGSMEPYQGASVGLKEGVNLNNRVQFTILQTDWYPPTLQDADSDGIEDDDDECPETAGPITTKGCPDSDLDGIVDNLDDCPNVAGIKNNNGCPELSEEIQAVLNEALEGIEFEMAKDIIKPSSYTILDKIVKILKENPTYNLKIAGHTDDQGKDEFNLLLSHRRAESTKRYLIEHGIESQRLDAVGYGESKPIADNGTDEGRSKNRRVEFLIIFQ